MTEASPRLRRSLGIVGGLGPLASADVFFKLVKATPASNDAEHFDLVFEQHPYRNAGRSREATVERMLYIFDTIREFEKRGIAAVVLPCFLSHTFIGQLQENSPLPIVDMIAGIRAHVRRRFPSARRIGVLTSDYVREEGLFERYFTTPEFEVIHPGRLAAGGLDRVTSAVYGERH